MTFVPTASVDVNMTDFEARVSAVEAGAAALAATNATLTAANQTLTGQLSAAGATITGLQTQVAALQAQVAALTPAPTVTLSASLSQAEGNSGSTPYIYTVTRSATAGAVSVAWSFAPGTTSANDFAGGAYPTGGTVSMAAGVASGTFTILVAGDTTFEPNELFTVSIAAPTGYAAGASMSATGTIVNDDAAPTTRTITVSGQPVTVSGVAVTAGA